MRNAERHKGTIGISGGKSLIRGNPHIKKIKTQKIQCPIQKITILQMSKNRIQKCIKIAFCQNRKRGENSLITDKRLWSSHIPIFNRYEQENIFWRDN